MFGTAQSLALCRRDSSQAELSKLQEEGQQAAAEAAAASAEATEAYQVLMQELTDCQQELDGILRDLKQLPHAWWALPPDNTTTHVGLEDSTL